MMGLPQIQRREYNTMSRECTTNTKKREQYYE